MKLTKKQKDDCYIDLFKMNDLTKQTNQINDWLCSGYISQKRSNSLKQTILIWQEKRLEAAE
jgi:hypothetical protein